MPHIKLDHVDFGYTSTLIIRDLSLVLDAPTVIGLVGRSGSGKTTLLKLLAGLLPPTGGLLRSAIEHVSWVPQDAGLYPWLTLAQNVAFPLTLRRQWQPPVLRLQVAEKLCHELRLGHAADHYPREASGGEKQRAAIARAIASASDLLLLDEPFASLDPKARQDLTRILRQATAANNMITVFASHDLFDVATLCDFVLVIPDAAEPMVERVSLPKLRAGRLRPQETVGDIVKTILMKLQPPGRGYRRGRDTDRSVQPRRTAGKGAKRRR